MSPQDVTGEIELPARAPDDPLPDRSAPPDHAEHSAVETEDLDPRRWRIFAVCATALFMVAIDSTIVATALPRIGGSLHAHINWLGWTITIYTFGQIVVMPLAGRISDQFGRKRLFLASIVLFTIASVACGCSTSIYMLVPLRLLQSVGGAGFLPSASGIVADHFGPDRDRALGMFSSIFPIGGIAGPIIGGLPIGIVLIVLVLRVIPDTVRRDGERIDVPGVLLLGSTIVAGMLAITSLGTRGASFSGPAVLVPAGVSIVIGTVFVRHVNRATSPIIPIRLLRGRGFAVMNVINLIFGSAGVGFGVLIPLYAENRYHIGESSAGTVLSLQAVGMSVVAAISSMLLRRTGYRRPMRLGFTVISGSLVLLAIAPHELSPYWWLGLISMLSGVGLGCAMPAANNATLSMAPDQIAAISGLRAFFRLIGSIIAVSVVTSVISRSSHPGLAQAHVFYVMAVLLAIPILLTFVVPERRSGW
jgi:MFS family permease